MELELGTGNPENLQSYFNTNQFWTMPFSIGRDIFSILIVTVSIYLLFDYRNKYSLMKAIHKEDNQTKIYLGVAPKYVMRELLIQNLVLYLEGFLFVFIVCTFMNLRLITFFNELLPYGISNEDKKQITITSFLFMLSIFVILILFSLLLETIYTHKFKKKFSRD